MLPYRGFAQRGSHSVVYDMGQKSAEVHLLLPYSPPGGYRDTSIEPTSDSDSVDERKTRKEDMDIYRDQYRSRIYRFASSSEFPRSSSRTSSKVYQSASESDSSQSSSQTSATSEYSEAPTKSPLSQKREDRSSKESEAKTLSGDDETPDDLQPFKNAKQSRGKSTQDVSKVVSSKRTKGKRPTEGGRSVSGPVRAKPSFDSDDIDTAVCNGKGISSISDEPRSHPPKSGQNQKKAVSSKDAQTQSPRNSPRQPKKQRASSDTVVSQTYPLPTKIQEERIEADKQQSLHVPPTSRSRSCNSATSGTRSPASRSLQVPSADSDSEQRAKDAQESQQSRFVPQFEKYSDQDDTDSKLRIHRALKSLDRISRTEGCIYVFEDPLCPGYVKIGRTEGPAQARVSAQARDCGRAYKLVEGSESGSFHYHAIVETLVHIELLPHRRKFACGKCKQKEKPDKPQLHDEWFNIGIEEALEVVHRWRSWIIHGRPFDSVGYLQNYWTRKLQDLKSSEAANLADWLKARPTEEELRSAYRIRLRESLREWFDAFLFMERVEIVKDKKYRLPSRWDRICMKGNTTPWLFLITFSLVGSIPGLLLALAAVLAMVALN